MIFQLKINIAPHTVVNWSNFCREVCLICLVDNSEKLVGNGVIVEIDEWNFACGEKETNLINLSKANQN